MELIFPWNELKNRGRGLTYDDVLIIPSRSDIRSRKDPDLSSRITKNISIPLPFISANMDTITEGDMAIGMHKLGAFGIIHRFMTIRDQTDEVIKVKEVGAQHIGASIGVNGDHKSEPKL